MKTQWHAIAQLLQAAPRARLAGLLALMIGAGFSEGAGLLLLLPLLDMFSKWHVSGEGTEAVAPAAHKLLELMRLLGLPVTHAGLLVGFVLLVSVAAGLQYARVVMAASVQQNWMDRMRAQCYEALLRADYRYLVRSRQSDHLQLLLTGIGRVGAGLNAGVALLAVCAVAMAYLVLSATLSPGLTVCALVGAFLLWMLLGFQRRQAYELGLGFAAANRRLQATAQAGLSGIKLTKMLGAESADLACFSEATAALREQQQRFNRSSGRARFSLQVLAAAAMATFVYLGLKVWQTPLPVLLMLVVLLGRLLPMFSNAQQQAQQWFNALPALEEVNLLLAQYAAVREPKLASAPDPDWSGDIKASKLTVWYEDRSRPALAGVTLNLVRGTLTALTGASGSGKSTLADVLGGLVRPDAGAVCIGEKMLQGEDAMRWRRSVAYVTQEVFLVHDTIRRNLLWGGGEATDLEICEALRHAAADFVLALPLGLDTVVGDAGVALSGGERQRLALARALLRRPMLLILDEVTSALDVENEQKVLDAVAALRGRITVLMIGHRPMMLAHADQVLSLHEGHLSEASSAIPSSVGWTQ